MPNFLGTLPGHKTRLWGIFKAILWLGSEQQTGAREITGISYTYLRMY
jgi:hypothetical protein